MKKILFGAILALAIASFGGTTVLAHAQTAPSSAVTPASQGTLEQQLELMKDKLELLQLQQMQGGAAAQTMTPAPAMAQTAEPASPTSPSLQISAADASALNSALSALATTLVTLQSAVQNNPQFMTQNGPVIARSLSGIEGSLAMVLTSISNSAPAQTNAAGPMAAAANPAASNPIAANSNSGSNSANGAPLVMANPTPANPVLPSVNSLTQPANTQQPAVATDELAGKNRLPAVIVGIILLAMIAILVWGRGGEELEPVVVRSDSKKSAPVTTPVATPVVPVPPSISFVSNQQSTSTTSTVTMSSSSPTPSPLASAMGQNQQKKA